MTRLGLAALVVTGKMGAETIFGDHTTKNQRQ
jgi:hypothetical protein